MSSRPVDHQHPVVGVVERVGCDLGSVASVPLLSMTPDQARAVLVRISQDEAQLASLKLRVLAHAEFSEATVATGAATAADWLAIETRQVRRDARSDLKLAEKLEHHDCLSAAMSQGRVNTAPARVIVAALDRLPRRGEFAVTAEQAAAEAHLVGLAAHHDAKALRVLGRHLFEVIAPELAERFEGQQLEAEEARALQRTRLTMWEDDEGTTHGRFRIPSLHGQMLSKMILAISSPARSTGAVDSGGACGIDPDLPTPVRHGIAFTQLIESITSEELPRTGGCGATVVVTMTLGQLLADLQEAGGVHPGHRRPPLRRRGPPAGVRGRNRPDGPRRPGPSPRRRPQNAGCTPRACGSRWGCATVAAPSRTARHRPGCAWPTTTSPGAAVDTPTSTPDACCARIITGASTTPATK